MHLVHGGGWGRLSKSFQLRIAAQPHQGPKPDGYRQENNVQLGNALALASEYINLWKTIARQSLETKLIHCCSPVLGIK